MKRTERIIQLPTGEWIRRNIQDNPFVMTLENIDSEISRCNDMILDLQDDIKEQKTKIK